jgi:hypothetical protein
MPDVVKHGWTHRPRSEGGTDPIPAAAGGLKWCTTFASAASITPSSGDYFFTHTDLYTNDTAAFEFADISAGRATWLQINTYGYYTCKFTASQATNWDNAFYTTITPMFEFVSTPADLIVNSGDADFPLNNFHNDAELNVGETAHKRLWQETSFHWNPADPQSDLDGEDPLKITFRVETVGATAAKTIQAQMFVVRIAGPGYTNVPA